MTTNAPLLEARQLTVSIGKNSVCRDLDLVLQPGERLAILGRNGAGKSTLLSVLAGLRAAQAGEVLLKGSNYAALGPRKSALIRGWLPQSRGDAFASTVLETAWLAVTRIWRAGIGNRPATQKSFVKLWRRLISPNLSNATCKRYPVASASGWRLPRCSRKNRNSFCSTNRLLTST